MCPYCENKQCYVDRHHIYYPRAAYRTALERQFRGMFIKKMWRCQHNELHATQRPPIKPTRKRMLQLMASQRRKQPQAA